MNGLQQLHDIPRRWAQRTPDAPALVDAGHRLSYASLWCQVQEAAASLDALGLRAGDRLMLVGENSAAQVIVLFAASLLGVWCVPVNARLTDSELAGLQAHAQVRRTAYVLAGSPAAAEHARAAGALSCALPGLSALAFGALDASCAVEAIPDDPGARVAALVYTTGTTGQAKGVMLTHGNLLFVARASAHVRAVCGEDRAYGGLPLSHVYGLSSVLFATLLSGACVHLAPRFVAADLDAMLVDAGLTILQGVPAMYARLLALRQGRPADPRWCLRGLFTGGAPLDPALKQAVEAHFGLPLHNGYGLTESAPSIAHTRLAAPRNDDAVGSALPGLELRIVGDDGQPVAPGAPGRLWVRGPGVMAGYYQAPELTAQVIDASGWLDTGDIARQDADGTLFILGRYKEMIIRSGFKVYPQEVEGVLNAFPAVLQSAVVGRAVADGNEEVVAFLEARPGMHVDLGQLRHWLTDRLAPYKCPAELVCLPVLPATASGKIRKVELARQAAVLGS